MGTFGDLILQRYSEEQPRDDHGRFGAGGGEGHSSGGGKSPTWESPLAEKTEHARNLGAQAFKDGQSRSPMGDTALHPLIGGPVGSGGAEVMTAWNKGWDTANLAAPVPGGEEKPSSGKWVSSTGAHNDGPSAVGKPIGAVGEHINANGTVMGLKMKQPDGTHSLSVKTDSGHVLAIHDPTGAKISSLNPGDHVAIKGKIAENDEMRPGRFLTTMGSDFTHEVLTPGNGVWDNRNFK